MDHMVLTLKAPITTAADDKFCNNCPNFLKKIRNDTSCRRFSGNIIPYLLFEKAEILNCRLLQIIGDTLRVKILTLLLPFTPNIICFVIC